MNPNILRYNSLDGILASYLQNALQAISILLRVCELIYYSWQLSVSLLQLDTYCSYHIHTIFIATQLYGD